MTIETDAVLKEIIVVWFGKLFWRRSSIAINVALPAPTQPDWRNSPCIETIMPIIDLSVNGETVFSGPATITEKIGGRPNVRHIIIEPANRNQEWRTLYVPEIYTEVLVPQYVADSS